jgi:hypothetical protein
MNQVDPLAHAECLGFIRAAIAEASRQTALDIKDVLAEVCNSGYADRAAMWRDLTATERQQFQTLLAPSVIAREAGQKNQRCDRLPVPRCGLRHRERVERGDRHGPAYSS